MKHSESGSESFATLLAAAKSSGQVPMLSQLLDQLDERIKFESLIADLSATFVNVASDRVDSQIEHVLQQIVEFLDIDQSSLVEQSEDTKRLFVTHSYVAPGIPLFHEFILEEKFPWYASKIREGEILRFTRLPDDLPADATSERQFCVQEGWKSNLTIPLKMGGSILGVVGFCSFRNYRDWPDELVDRLKLIGEILANALARKRSEQELRESERRLAATFEQAAVGIAHFEANEQWLRVNQKFCDLIGYRREELAGMTFEEITHPEDIAVDLEYRRQLKAAEIQSYSREKRYFRKDGTPIWVNVTVSPVRSVSDRVDYYTAVVQDITDRKRSEAESQRLKDQLAHVGRVTTMGELAAAIAHEVNQPLCAIITNAQAALRLLAANGSERDEILETLEDIVAGGRRTHEVISRIRNMLQNRHPEMAAMDLNDAIQEVVGLIKQQAARHGTRLVLELHSDLAAIFADRIQIQQVVLNLALNGIEAMNSAPGSNHELTIRSGRDDEEKVFVTVSDTGTGVSNADLDRIFDAFYSTKANGLGIGLAISRSIIEAHGGRIWAESNPGQGAAFHFALPVMKECAT